MAKVTRILLIKGGEVTMDSTGFVGSACEQATKPYVDALGVPDDKVKQDKKPEFAEVSQDAGQSQQVG